MDYSPWYRLLRSANGKCIVHDIDSPLWSTEIGPWTIIHGVHGIDPASMAEGKWIMDYSP